MKQASYDKKQQPIKIRSKNSKALKSVGETE